MSGQHENKGNVYEPLALKSLKLEADEPAVAGPYRSSGCAFAWAVVVAEEGPAGLAGEDREVCLLVTDCGLSGVGDGIDGIDPRCELALEMLWLRLETLASVRALRGGELGAKRPWAVCGCGCGSSASALPCSLTDLTSPTLSPVKSVCKFFNFFSNASCSSNRRSASSLRSYSPSVSDSSDDSGEAGRNADGSRRCPPRSVRTEEEEGRWFAREGELLVSEFRRARTPSGAVSRTDVDSLERLDRKSVV